MTNLTAQKYTIFNLNISAYTLLMDSKFWKCICVVLRYPHAHFQEFLKYGKNLCVCAHACVCLFVRFQQLTKKMQYRREMFGLTAQQYYGQSRPKSCLSGASQKMEKLHQQQIKQVWPQGKLEAFFLLQQCESNSANHFTMAHNGNSFCHVLQMWFNSVIASYVTKHESSNCNYVELKVVKAIISNLYQYRK